MPEQGLSKRPLVEGLPCLAPDVVETQDLRDERGQAPHSAIVVEVSALAEAGGREVVSAPPHHLDLDLFEQAKGHER